MATSDLREEVRACCAAAARSVTGDGADGCCAPAAEALEVDDGFGAALYDTDALLSAGGSGRPASPTGWT